MSPARPFDPRQLDVSAFTRAAARLQGAWPLSGMPRLVQDLLPQPAGEASWSVQGERRPVAGGDDRILLHLQVDTEVPLACQRCLQPVGVPLQLRTTLRFVQSEALAEKLDEDSDEDVLALSGSLDLHELVEDELILALPLVPRHAQCPQPLAMSAAEAEAKEQPFAQLASLLRGNREGGKSG